MTLSLDIVVVNYHTEADLDRFIESLEQHAPATVDISLIVFDVEQERANEIFYWGNDRSGLRMGHPENVGYARACNQAASMRDGKIIGLFNADTAFLPGTLTKILGAFEENDRWDILGPKQVNGRGEITHAGMFGTNKNTRPRGWKEIDRGQYDDVAEAITVSGSAYFIRRSVWEELTDCVTYRQVAPSAAGAFLPTKHYYEETWCSYHARHHGHTVVYFGEATMIHEWHQASPVGGWAEQQMNESRALFRLACDRHGIERD